MFPNEMFCEGWKMENEENAKFVSYRGTTKL